MKPELLQILQHSLGLDQYGLGRRYRNHFVAGGDDEFKCRELVVLGFMCEVRMASELTGELPCFAVTKAGVEAIKVNSPAAPKLTRGQQRYKRYLQYCECFKSFLDFCYWDAAYRKSENGR